MTNNDHGCAEIAPKCARCGHSLVWQKGRLFQPAESHPSQSMTGARPHFADFRGGWICPECDGRVPADAAPEHRPAVSSPV